MSPGQDEVDDDRTTDGRSDRTTGPAGHLGGPGPRVGYTEGVFDLFHRGHLDHITAAARGCDRLVVGVLDDELAEAVAGQRPFVPVAERRAVVEAVRGVDTTVAVTDVDLAGIAERTGFAVVFTHGGPTAGDGARTAGNGAWETVRLPDPRPTTSSVLRTALAVDAVAAAEV